MNTTHTNSLQQKEISRPFVNSPKPLEYANVNQWPTVIILDMILTYFTVGTEVHLHRDAGVIFTKDFMFKKDLLFWKFIENFNILAQKDEN